MVQDHAWYTQLPVEYFLVSGIAKHSWAPGIFSVWTVWLHFFVIEMSFPTGDALTQQPISKGKAKGKQTPQRWSTSKKNKNKKTPE